MTDLHNENDGATQFDGPPTPSQGKAPLPDPEQAAVTHYAYDPQTYEILCRPGQRLSEKKTQRLQELDLYAHVVAFSEEHSL
jgi:hypothetical protein